ncbi:MAG: adenosylcobinamide-phosphate synthase CbiB [Chitinispirillaceae bacterium]
MMPLALLFAVLLDSVLGDPRWLPHPIRWIGHLIRFTERFTYPKQRAVSGEFAAGCFTSAVVAGSCALSVYLILSICKQISAIAFFSLQVIIGFYCLSARSLIDEANRVRMFIQADNLPAAREALSMIVGRDTENLDEAAVIRATVETVAENISDGITSPLVYMAVAGPVGAVVYKAVSTMDSMIGHRNSRYRHFGTCAARLDDILNFIPARITAFFLIPAVAFLFGLKWKESLYVTIRDRLKHESPNSAHGEAAMAGALGICLGGGAFYNGVFSSRPYLGNDIRPAAAAVIVQAGHITMGVTAIAAAITFAALYSVYGIQ